MQAPLRLGLAGLGTVGTGVIRILQENAALIAARAGRPVEITVPSHPRVSKVFHRMSGGPG